MDQLTAALTRLRVDLDATGVAWALIGGLAVSVRAEPRTTRDVDVAVATADDDGAEALVRRLFDRGYRLVGHLERTDRARLAAVRLTPPHSDVLGIVVDLLFASSGIEAEIARTAEVLEIVPGLRVPVATTGYLIALKVLASAPDRPQDLGDARSLLLRAPSSEIRRAKDAIDLIVRRGFERGKDLRSELESLLEAAPSPDWRS